MRRKRGRWAPPAAARARGSCSRGAPAGVTSPRPRWRPGTSVAHESRVVHEQDLVSVRSARDAIREPRVSLVQLPRVESQRHRPGRRRPPASLDDRVLDPLGEVRGDQCPGERGVSSELLRQARAALHSGDVSEEQQPGPAPDEGCVVGLLDGGVIFFTLAARGQLRTAAWEPGLGAGDCLAAARQNHRGDHDDRPCLESLLESVAHLLLHAHRAPSIAATSRATVAPASVAARLTPSLSSHWNPPAGSVFLPHMCRTRSVATAHPSHQLRACTVAPRRESAVVPAIPPATAPATAPSGHPLIHASNATNAAPASPPALPSNVTPPDVPVGSGRPVVIDRGELSARVPISVAHVSAAAAARAPAPTTVQAADTWRSDISAAKAKRPPFARTCTAS